MWSRAFSAIRETRPGGGGNILAPISGAVNLQAMRVTTHQFSVSIPIR